MRSLPLNVVARDAGRANRDRVAGRLYSGHADVPGAENADLTLHKPLDLASLCSALRSLSGPP